MIFVHASHKNVNNLTYLISSQFWIVSCCCLNVFIECRMYRIYDVRWSFVLFLVKVSCDKIYRNLTKCPHLPSLAQHPCCMALVTVSPCWHHKQEAVTSQWWNNTCTGWTSDCCAWSMRRKTVCDASASCIPSLLLIFCYSWSSGYPDREGNLVWKITLSVGNRSNTSRPCKPDIHQPDTAWPWPWQISRSQHCSCLNDYLRRHAIGFLMFTQDLALFVRLCSLECEGHLIKLSHVFM